MPTLLPAVVLLVALFPARPVLVAPRGLPEHTKEYGDCDKRDDRENEQTYYGEAQKLFLPCVQRPPGETQWPPYYPMPGLAV